MVVEGEAPPKGLSVRNRVAFFETVANNEADKEGAPKSKNPSLHASAAAAQLAPLAGQVHAPHPRSVRTDDTRFVIGPGALEWSRALNGCVVHASLQHPAPQLKRCAIAGEAVRGGHFDSAEEGAGHGRPSASRVAK